MTKLIFEEIEVLIRGSIRRCKGQPINPATFGRAKSDMVRGLIPLSADKALRIPCGYDFNNTILSFPFDGKEHEVLCPNCGIETSFRSPIF